MRAFVALLPPPPVVEDLEGHLAPRRGGGDPDRCWRWTPADQLHVTLAFLPDLESRAEEPVVEEVQAWAEAHPPAQLRLAGAGAFPDPLSARVLWVGVDDTSAGWSVPSGGVLSGWARDIRARCSRAGARVQGRAFSPHLTVARSRGHRPTPAGRLVQALDTYRSMPWTAAEVVLLASHLGQGPRGTPRYEELHRWVLRAGETRAP
jgi:RNA 2',3'-cyclic 3'-phosphodiesterase